MKNGFVYLVGAGPGAPGLITVRGAELVRQADVVLYDGLINPALLAQTSPHCERICVGKHGKTRVWSQAEIDDEIVVHARQGKSVVRLKGGDTAIFARTAEELDRLVRENIPFEVVPGISAASAASSHAGISITHRDWASAVAFVTGQSQAIDGGSEAEESFDWNALAAFPGTLVFYMGVTSAERWSSELMRAGMSPSTPVAMVRRCSWPDQQVMRGTLLEVSQGILQGLRPPVISIVGTVAGLGDSFAWFAKRLLFGTTVLVTRQETEADPWTKELEELGAEVLRQPAIAIKSLEDFTELDRAIHRLDQFDWLLFTSRNGVHSFFQRFHQLGLDARQLANVRLAGVGPSIEEALREWHLKIDLMPKMEYNASSLANALQAQAANQRCLWIRTNRGRDDLAELLTQAKAKVTSVVAYLSEDIEVADPDVAQRLALGEIHFMAVSSSGIARSLVRMFGESLRKTKLVSISPLTSQTLKELGYPAAFEAVDAKMVEAIIAGSEACDSNFHSEAPPNRSSQT